MTQPVAPAPIEPALAEVQSFIAATLDALLPQASGTEAPLLEAMRRAALGVRRRWRGFLVLQSGRLFGVDRRASARVAAAVECLHTSSQSHETGGVIAALAGDGLLTLAFGLIATPEAHGDPFVRCELLAKLAAAAGYGGTVGGRGLDLIFAGETPPLPELTRLSRMKTAALVAFACEAGAIMGRASAGVRQALLAYGHELGLALQIADDLAGKDASGAARMVAALGPERARAQTEALAGQAAHHLDIFDEKADLLRAAAHFIVASPV